MDGLIGQKGMDVPVVCAAHAMAPLTIVYEHLVEHWEPTLRRALRYIGTPGADTIALPPPPLRRQSGGRSQEWVERFVGAPALSRSSAG